MRQLQDLVPLHRDYAALTRSVAGAAGAVLCDAAAAFDALPAPAREYFQPDGIQLTQAGNRVLSSVLARASTRASRHRRPARSTRSFTKEPKGT